MTRQDVAASVGDRPLNSLYRRAIPRRRELTAVNSAEARAPHRRRDQRSTLDPTSAGKNGAPCGPGTSPTCTEAGAPASRGGTGRRRGLHVRPPRPSTRTVNRRFRVPPGRGPGVLCRATAGVPIAVAPTPASDHVVGRGDTGDARATPVQAVPVVDVPAHMRALDHDRLCTPKARMARGSISIAAATAASEDGQIADDGLCGHLRLALPAETLSARARDGAPPRPLRSTERMEAHLSHRSSHARTRRPSLDHRHQAIAIRTPHHRACLAHPPLLAEKRGKDSTRWATGARGRFNCTPFRPLPQPPWSGPGWRAVACRRAVLGGSRLSRMRRPRGADEEIEIRMAPRERPAQPVLGGAVLSRADHPRLGYDGEACATARNCLNSHGSPP